MKDVAISFEKISLDQSRNKYLFKPICVIKGEYDAEEKIFFSNKGDYYDILDGSDPCDEYYIDCETTIDELRKTFGSTATEDEILNKYFEICTNYLYVGYYDEYTCGLKISRILFDNIIDSIMENIGLQEIADLGFRYAFTKQELQEIRDLTSLTEIKNKLDEIIKDADEEYECVIDDEAYTTEPEIKLYPSVVINKKSDNNITLKELRKEVLSKIVGQDDAVNDITRSIMINQTSINPNNKSHLLVTGPTGTGKTEIIKIICHELNLPFFEADATAYTKEGYVGKSVYSMLDGLIENASGNISDAEKGILVIDEIDKKVLDKSNSDVGGKAVIYSLLKIMDRGIVQLDDDSFDTSNLTIICMGAFDEFYQNKLKENRKIGFGEIETLKQIKNTILTKEDLIKGGTPAEFLGRIGDIVSTRPFEESDLINILNNSSISALAFQKQYFKEAFNTELISTDDYISEIAKQAMKFKTNARELKPLIRQSLKYAIDELLSGTKAKTLKITKETALDPKKYYIS